MKPPRMQRVKRGNRQPFHAEALNFDCFYSALRDLETALSHGSTSFRRKPRPRVELAPPDPEACRGEKQRKTCFDVATRCVRCMGVAVSVLPRKRHVGRLGSGSAWRGPACGGPGPTGGQRPSKRPFRSYTGHVCVEALLRLVVLSMGNFTSVRSAGSCRSGVAGALAVLLRFAVRGNICSCYGSQRRPHPPRTLSTDVGLGR